MTSAGTLVAKGRAGPPDRMLAVASAIVYARVRGRQLVVDWRDETYSNEGTNARNARSVRRLERLPIATGGRAW